MCEAYVPIALEHLSLGAPNPNRESETTFSGEVELLRLTFLFPRFRDKATELLLNLRNLRWLYGNCKRHDEIAGKQDPTLCPEHLEAEFDAKRREIEPHLPAFSPIQQEILREKFLRIEGQHDGGEAQ